MAWIRRRDEFKARRAKRWELGYRDANGVRHFEYFDTERDAKAQGPQGRV